MSEDSASGSLVTYIGKGSRHRTSRSRILLTQPHLIFIIYFLRIKLIHKFKYPQIPTNRDPTTERH